MIKYLFFILLFLQLFSYAYSETCYSICSASDQYQLYICSPLPRSSLNELEKTLCTSITNNTIISNSTTETNTTLTSKTQSPSSETFITPSPSSETITTPSPNSETFTTPSPSSNSPSWSVAVE